MRYGDIIEKRTVDQGKHRMTLEVLTDELYKTYDEYSNDIAEKIVYNHLNQREDDGRASNIRIEEPNEHNIIKIHADIEYEGNEHTGYEDMQ